MPIKSYHIMGIAMAPLYKCVRALWQWLSREPLRCWPILLAHCLDGSTWGGKHAGCNDGFELIHKEESGGNERDAPNQTLEKALCHAVLTHEQLSCLSDTAVFC